MPPVGRAEQALRAQKDARQKKILIVLAPFLLALLAWQGPGMLKAFSAGDPPPPAPAQQSVATPTTPVDPTAGAAPSTATGEAAPVSGTPVPLPEGDEPVEPGAGQLVSFDRFVGKDPFRQQVEAITADEGGGAAPVDDGSTDGGGDGGSGGSSGSGSGGGSGGGGSGGGSGGGGSGGGGADGGGGDGAGGGGDDGGTTPSLARLSVNGVAGDVSAGGTFPTSDPIFRLVSLSSSSVKIGLVSGEFSNGAETITVRQGKTVTLISQPDGFRYTIKLISLGQSF